MTEYKIERPVGTWFVWLCMALCVVILWVAAHTQAPLTTLDCPYNEGNAKGQSAQENCAAFGILLLRSWYDLRTGIGGFIHDNKDDITAVSTVIIAIFTGTLWWVTWRMVRIAQEQRADMLLAIYAANEANIISQHNLAASQRPWLKPLVKISGPLEYVHKGDLEVGLSLGIENIGKSPATKVYITSELNAWPIGCDDLIANTQAMVSNVAKWRSGSFTEAIVFPGDRIGPYRVPKVHYSEIEKFSKESSAMKIILIGCIDYAIPFSDKHHQTWFCCEVRMRNSPSELIQRRYGDIPADNLILVGVHSAQNYAD